MKMTRYFDLRHIQFPQGQFEPYGEPQEPVWILPSQAGTNFSTVTSTWSPHWRQLHRTFNRNRKGLRRRLIFEIMVWLRRPNAASGFLSMLHTTEAQPILALVMIPLSTES